MLFSRILIGLVMIGIGVALVYFSRQLVESFGHISWAGKYLGAMAGTYSLYRIVGVLIALAGFLYMTGMLSGLFGSILGPLTGGFRS